MSRRDITQRVALVSLGCPKNLVDSEIMLGVLLEDGFELTTDEGEADILVVNTCGFIQDAKEESIDAILRLAEYKKTGRCRTLVVAGCLAQRYRDELAEELPEVDYFIGTGEYPRIGELIRNGGERRTVVEPPPYIHDHTTPRLLSTTGVSTYVKIAEGCSNRCSYCTIPAIRGDFRSRTVESVAKEVEGLAIEGIKEINLIAQDTTSYGRDLDGDGLFSLLRRLVGIDGLEWIRLLYLYPSRVTDELISLIRDEERIVKYLDIPIQHINTRILEAMNRPYTRKDVERLIEKVRKAIPGVVLRTSLIVGFPGEGEREFKELLSFVKDTCFERLGVFRYSREEDTPAWGMEGHLSESIKHERFERIMEAQSSISLGHNRKLIGTTLRVLVEEMDDQGIRGRWEGQAPDVDGITHITEGNGLCPGRFVSIKVTDAWEYDIAGRIR